MRSMSQCCSIVRPCWQRRISSRNSLDQRGGTRVETVKVQEVKGVVQCAISVACGWRGSGFGADVFTAVCAVIFEYTGFIRRYFFECGVPRYGNSFVTSVWGLRPVGGH